MDVVFKPPGGAYPGDQTSNLTFAMDFTVYNPEPCLYQISTQNTYLYGINRIFIVLFKEVVDFLRPQGAYPGR